jgi:hypothetical protein
MRAEIVENTVAWDLLCLPCWSAGVVGLVPIEVGAEGDKSAECVFGQETTEGKEVGVPASV